MFLASSDERLKDKIQELGPVLEKVRRLSAKSYIWKKGPSDQRHTGLLAQDVEREFPDLVRTDADGFKAIDYAGLSAVILNSVVELENSYEARLSEINRRLEALEKR